MQYIKFALPLALATGVLANPLKRDTCTSDTCLAAVTGKAALGDDTLRADHCKSFLATTVTPEAVTVTSTITGVETDSSWQKWKRVEVTVCPNEVPNYASACETQAYSSACACFGFSGDSTTTLDPATSTKTVYVSPTAASCSNGTSTTTKTITVTVGGGAYTSTPSDSASTSAFGGFNATSTPSDSFCATTTVSICPTTSGFGFLSTSTVTSTSAITSTVTSTKTTTESASSCPTTTATTSTITSATTSTVTSTETSTETTTETGSSCPTTTATTSTITTTETSSFCPTTTDASTSTYTTTTTETTTTTSSSAAEATCLTQDQVDYFVESFIDFLENTDTGSQLGYSGPFNSELAAEVFTEDFSDTSDGINYMAGIPLGSVTFPSRDAFIAGQGSQYPVSVETLNTWVGCKFFSWRYTIAAGVNPVVGINVFDVTDDLSQIKANHAEFNSGAWIEDISNPSGLCGQAAAVSAAVSSVEATCTTDAPTTSSTTTSSAASDPTDE